MVPVSVTVMDMPRVMTATRINAGSEDVDGLRRAADYDRSLLEGGNIAVGEAADPFTGGTTPMYVSDQAYQSQGGTGDSMAVVRIPSIGVNLPVGHGTGSGVLEMQAGHVYGTTLPVGDPGNSVIAGHRGLGQRLLFYRVGELTEGDMVYTSMLGRTVAWKVTGRLLVDPGSMEERNAIALGDGTVTRLTLYTCDPPGLNTRRLLVQAIRVPYVDASTHSWQEPWMDPWRLWAVWMLVTVVACFMVRFLSAHGRVVRHAIVRPRRFR